MAEDLKFAFVATGVNNEEGHPPRTFTNMGPVHVASLIDRLKHDKVVAALITKPARVRFFHFSFVDNDILVRDEFFGEAGNDADRKWKSHSAVSDTLSSFIVQSALLSVQDIYHSIRKAPRGSVLDLSMYSHGFVEGPVLADTTDKFYAGSNFNGDPNTPRRDPDDRDPRVRTDFFPNMGEDPAGTGQNALSEFAGGFVTGASFRVFGCNVQDVVIAGSNKERLFLRSIAFEVIREAYTLPVKKRTAVGRQLLKGQQPSGSISLDMGHEFALELSLHDDAFSDHFQGQPITEPVLLQLHYGNDPAFFDGDTGGVITRPYSDVIKLAATKVLDTYIVQAAAGLPGVTCFGAVPGVGGDLDQEGRFRLMNVNRSTYGALLKFYTTFLGVSMFEKGAPKQRNYGVFDSNTISVLQNHKANG